MSFIVQISPFVHLFTIKIVFRFPEPPTRALPWTCWGFKRPTDTSPQVVPTFHCIPNYAPGIVSFVMSSLCVICSMLPMSLCCPFLIALKVCSNIYLS